MVNSHVKIFTPVGIAMIIVMMPKNALTGGGDFRENAEGVGLPPSALVSFARKKLFGYKSMVGATLAIGILSFLVWLHHFFTMGSGANDVRQPGLGLGPPGGLHPGASVRST
jgi:Cytochrome C and Quinol oxidase polypeptide I